ncbi:hypothetical protein [Nocardia sp. NPDC060259]|uniref:LppU/SCO3897 family protein n=1 Tax=Nocardia sp. NPDC060259 TaxID=3347088 RepID=UPI0036651A14
MAHPSPQQPAAQWRPVEFPTPVPPEPLTEPTRSARKRLLPWLLVALATIVAVAGGVTVYALTRPEPPTMAVGDCVSNSPQPIEYGCTAPTAMYKIVGREPIQWPLELACLKYPDATRAVAEPSAPGTAATTALCLAPTANNPVDPGGLVAGDCIDVKKAGETIERLPCGTSRASLDVIAIELHTKVPVTDNACRAYQDTRMAFAQTSLGGRAVVVCTKPNGFATTASAAQVGDCYSEQPMAKVACDGAGASSRVLSVRTQYVAPAKPECLGVTNTTSVSVTSNEKTDLIVVVCLGPVSPAQLGYAKPGDCVTGFATSSDMPTLVDCAAPTADGQVTSVYDSDGVACSPGEARMTRKQSMSEGTTICLGPL